jgi:hypothetical protein
MAAAVVAGCALTVRQYLVDERSHQPSAALLKAILVNGARWLGGSDAIADHSAAPNYHQGFGCVSLQDSVPSPSSGLVLEFVDAWNDASLDIAANGGGVEFALEIGEGPLRLCLAWTDLPRNRVQNALGFQLQHERSGAAWFGNEHRPGLRRQPYDPNNNVQVIQIGNAPAGTFKLFVQAVNLFRGPQRFALAVTGSVSRRIELVEAF